jgi:hypothetical protein
MKVVYGRPGTAPLAAKDEGVEIFYASEMKARVGARESTYYDGRGPGRCPRIYTSYEL